MDHTLHQLFGGEGYMPHGHCYLWQPNLVWTMVISDTLIGLSYATISFLLYRTMRRARLPFSAMLGAFGLFILACGATHLIEVYTLWVPAYWFSASMKVVTATASVATALWLFPVSRQIVAIVDAAKKAESQGRELRRKTAEVAQVNRSLSQAEARFEALVNGVRDYAIYMMDVEGNIVTWNEGANQLIGYGESEILGKNFALFYPEEERRRKKPEKELEIAAVQGRAEDEGWRVRKDGSRFWANVVITRMQDADENLLGFSKIVRDLSERRQAEDLMRLVNEGLEQRVQERTSELKYALRARDEFLSIASHELKTPLTSLKLQLEMTERALHREGLLANDRKKLFELPLRQIKTLVDLVEDLTDVARVRTGRFQLKRELISLNDLIRDVAARLAPQLALAKCEVILDLTGTIQGMWDRKRLEQVFVNLFSNSMKYAPGSKVHVTATQKQQMAYFCFSDSGPGISAEQQQKIFNIFERVDQNSRVGGLGLGLFIVRQIISAHEGEIQVESRAGEGAKFVASIPLQPRSEELAL